MMISVLLFGLMTTVSGVATLLAVLSGDTERAILFAIFSVFFQNFLIDSVKNK